MTQQQLLAALQKVLPNGYQADGYLKAGGQGAVFRGSVNGQDAVL
jgi:hypothetical protein